MPLNQIEAFPTQKSYANTNFNRRVNLTLLFVSTLTEVGKDLKTGII